jgi:hypothetical protein
MNNRGQETEACYMAHELGIAEIRSFLDTAKTSDLSTPLIACESFIRALLMALVASLTALSTMGMRSYWPQLTALTTFAG